MRIMSALGMKNTGLYQSVVVYTGPMAFLFIRSCTTVSAPFSYLRAGSCDFLRDGVWLETYPHWITLHWFRVELVT